MNLRRIARLIGVLVAMPGLAGNAVFYFGSVAGPVGVAKPPDD